MKDLKLLLYLTFTSIGNGLFKVYKQVEKIEDYLEKNYENNENDNESMIDSIHTWYHKHF